MSVRAVQKLSKWTCCARRDLQYRKGLTSISSCNVCSLPRLVGPPLRRAAFLIVVVGSHVARALLDMLTVLRKTRRERPAVSTCSHHTYTKYRGWRIPQSGTSRNSTTLGVHQLESLTEVAHLGVDKAVSTRIDLHISTSSCL